MSLTSLADRKTPGRPIELTFDPETGLPSANQEVLLIAHRGAGAGSGTAEAYGVTSITNSGDAEAAKEEAETKFGVGSEAALAVVAAVKANEGESSVPVLKVMPLASTDTDFGAADIALTNVKRVKAEFIVSPYTGSEATLRGKMKDAAAAMSSAERVENNQFGTTAVVFERAVTDPSTLAAPDTQNLMAVWMPDTGTGDDAPAYSIAEMAAAAAARAAAQGSPFNPLDNVVLHNVVAPVKTSDWITVGAALESEAALTKGWTPLRVKSNGDVAFVRTVTTRITVDGTVAATAYYDLQDFQVMYLFRRTVFTRLNQPDLKQVKASVETAKLVKSEVIRLMKLFETGGMFQAVDKLAKQVVVERSVSDRHRFDMAIPINVIPGLHVIASNVKAGTQFDTFSV